MCHDKLDFYNNTKIRILLRQTRRQFKALEITSNTSYKHLQRFHDLTSCYTTVLYSKCPFAQINQLAL